MDDPLLAPHRHPVELPEPDRYVGLAGDWHGNDRWAHRV